MNEGNSYFIVQLSHHPFYIIGESSYCNSHLIRPKGDETENELPIYCHFPTTFSG